MGSNKWNGPAELWGQISKSATFEAHKEENKEIPAKESDGLQKGDKKPIDPKKLNPYATRSRPLVVADADTPKEPDIEGISKKVQNIVPAQHRPDDFHLDRAERLMPESFPNPAGRGSIRTPSTIPNLNHLLNSYGINVRYDVIKKKLNVNIPGLVGAADNSDNVALSQIISLATLNNMSVGQVPSFLEAIGNREPYNPVADWIKSKSWDGKDRLHAFYDTLTAHEDFLEPLKCRLVERWLISAVAAAFMPSGFHSRGVLTLVGEQSIGKTRWVAAMVPDNGLRERLVKLDHHLDAGNKDTQITALSHWLVEIGELDSSFKRDVARLKGFITRENDKIRRPYGRGDSEYGRHTVFCATVNDDQFLVDTTGNTRFWTIPVVAVDYQHDIDMQQLWAQAALKYEKGEPWWLTKAEEQCLERYNKHHIVVNPVTERVLHILDLSRKGEDGLPAMTATEVLKKAGFEYPTNPQQKDCNALLRRELGRSRRIQGLNKWRVPLAEGSSFSGKYDDKF